LLVSDITINGTGENGMLNLMRKHARNWLMKVIMGIIVVVFVISFGSLSVRQRAERIAMIDGKPIVQADFQREYQNMLDVYRQRLGQGLTEEVLKALNLKQQALDRLINEAVLMKKAEEMEIRVTDEDVKAAILSYPAFQRDGIFDERLYEQTIRGFKMSPEEFEESQRRMLVSFRVQDLIQDGVNLSNREIHDFYVMQNEKVNVEFLQISPKNFISGIKPTQTDLEAFLKANGGQFRVPEQFRFKYLAFLAQDYASTARLSDAEINDYYERNKTKWKKGDKVQPLAEVRDRVVAELGQIEGMYAASAEAKKAHDTIYQEENFDGYAAKKNLTVQTTGYFRITDVPPEFKAFTDFGKMVSRMEKKEISRVLQGDKGYFIIQIADRKAPYLPALNEIQSEVDRRCREVEAARLAKREANDLLARLKKGESLATVSKENRLKIGETGLFQPGSGAVPKLGGSPELTEALFQISEKKPYPEQACHVGEDYVILRFKERGSVDEAAFASQRNTFAGSLIQTKKSEAVKSWIEGSKAALIKAGRLKFTRDPKEL
jgi:peptidyl-prolyl cis-trans isomerase D